MSVHICPYFFFSMELPNTVQRDIMGLFKFLVFLRMALYQNIVSESESHSVVSNSVTPWTVHGILQARIQEWVTYPFSRGSSQPRNQTRVSCIAGRFFTNSAMREVLIKTSFWFYFKFQIIKVIDFKM